jgi:hypothetical protein
MAFQQDLYRVKRGDRVNLTVKKELFFFALLPYFSIAEYKIKEKSGKGEKEDNHKPCQYRTMISPQVEHMEHRDRLRRDLKRDVKNDITHLLHPFFSSLMLRTFRAKPGKWQGLKSLQPPEASRICRMREITNLFALV